MDGHQISTIPSIADEFGALAGVLETAASVIEVFAIVVLLNGLARFAVASVASELAARDRDNKEQTKIQQITKRRPLWWHNL